MRLEIATDDRVERWRDIALHDTGGCGPPLVLANGLGGPFVSWRHQVDYLRDRHRIVSWDYRGLYGSSRPSGDPPRVGVDAHVDDLERVLEATGIERAAFIGWSMGVQVILELYERRPEIVTHLVLINGTYGKPLTTVGMPFSSRMCPAPWSGFASMHTFASSCSAAPRAGPRP